MELANKRQPIENFETEDPNCADGVSPEQRLWAAVIERTVMDFRDLFARVEKQVRTAQSYSTDLLFEYYAFLRELEHQDFVNVCDFANVPHSKPLELFKREAKACGLFDYPSYRPKYRNYNRKLRSWN